MPYEDFSPGTGADYIYVDGSGYFSIPTGNPNRIDFTAIPPNSTSRVYKDMGTGDYLLNFEVEFDFEITDIQSADSAVMIFRASSETLWGYGNASAIGVEALSTTTFQLKLSQPTYATQLSTTLNKNTVYYIRAYRTYTAFIVEIYGSNSDRQSRINVIDTVGVGGLTPTAWQYYHVGASANHAVSDTITGYVENVNIVSSDVDYGTQLLSVIDIFDYGYYTGLSFTTTNDALFVDSNGDIHITGHSHGSASPSYNHGYIYYQVSTDGGITFTDGEGGGTDSYKQWSTGVTTYPSTSSVVVDSSGNVYVFYVMGSLYMIKKPNTTGGVFGSAVVISTGGSFGNSLGGLQAVVDTNDNLIVTASGNYDGNPSMVMVCTSDDAGTTWTEEYRAGTTTSGSSSDLTVASTNDIYFASIGTVYYGYQGNSAVKKITRSAVTGGYEWAVGSPENILSPGTGDSYEIFSTAIVAERDTEIIWQFVAMDDNGTYKIKYNKKVSGSWGTWQTLLSKTGGTGENHYDGLSVARDYDNNIFLTYNMHDGTTSILPTYIIPYGGGTWGTSSILEAQGLKCALQSNPMNSGTIDLYYSYQDIGGIKYLSSYNTNQFNGSDSITLDDEIFVNIPLQNLNLEESLTVSDAITFAKEVFLGDSLALTDEIEVDVSQEKVYFDDLIALTDEIVSGTVKDIDNDFRMAVGVISDINNKINTVIESKVDIDNKINTAKLILEDIDNKINTVIEETPGISNRFNSAYGDINDISNDVRIAGLNQSNLFNDFRMIKSWQVPGISGAQSLGKSYVKVYINSVEQTDAVVDSINITKTINAPHTTSFILARPYDTTKPALESMVEIKYNDILIYKGYIVTVSPSDTPEQIAINCNNIHWKNNRTQTWFNVGHIPSDNTELYYNTVSSALSSLGINWNIGNFIPETMTLFGAGESDAITNLVTNTGNFGWYYDELENKKLWSGGGGSVVQLDKQELGKNIGLYQIIKHTITESADGIINKLRVQMGNEVMKYFGSNSEHKTYVNHYYGIQRVTAVPAWNPALEVTAKDSDSGFGFDFHPDESDYGDVYKKYKFPHPSIINESWSDWRRPIIEITPRNFGAGTPSGQDGVLKDGFSVDFENGILTLSEKLFYYDKSTFGADRGTITQRTAPQVTLIMYKQKKVTTTENPTQNPGGELTNELMFFTNKIGDYTPTVQGVLNLGGLSIQHGGIYVTIDGDNNRIIHYVPSWNDTQFAEDLAYWNLSKTAYSKVKGTVTITLDAMLFYNLNLSKRIMINGIIDSPLNITGINYDFNNFTVTLNVENFAFFKRSVSKQSHGEGLS